MSRGTGQKCIRLADAVWEQFGQVAATKGTTRTELIRAWIKAYVESEGKRPK